MTHLPLPGLPQDISGPDASGAASGRDEILVKAEVLKNGVALPPLEAPAEVLKIIEAGNAIARTPYKWGGGHGKWTDTGYDCSGSVSFALAARAGRAGRLRARVAEPRVLLGLCGRGGAGRAGLGLHDARPQLLRQRRQLRLSPHLALAGQVLLLALAGRTDRQVAAADQGDAEQAREQGGAAHPPSMAADHRPRLQKEVRAAAPRLVIPMCTWSRCATVLSSLRLSFPRLP